MDTPNTSRLVLSLATRNSQLHPSPQRAASPSHHHICPYFTYTNFTNSPFVIQPLPPCFLCLGTIGAIMSPGRDLPRVSSPLQDPQWRVIRGDRTLPPNQTWTRERHQEEEGVIIREMPPSPFSQLFADLRSERMARQERLHPPSQGFAGSDDEDFGGDTGVDVDVDVNHMDGDEGDIEHDGSEVEDVEDVEEEEEQSFDAGAVGLKEISNLASFTVSSYKPGCGVKELRDDDVNQYWQSDGPQPHRLNIHFIKRVEIRALRLYLDYELDESYTPTKIQITAGTGPNLTIPFTTMELNTPKGWIDIPIAGAGGGPDGNSLCCFFVRVIILENHQNGKDTHIRGIKVYALDEGADTVDNNPIDDVVNDLEDYRLRIKRMSLGDSDEDISMHLDAQARKRKANPKKYAPGDGGLSIPDFMREPEIR
ncbi:anaphase-promoting complex, subunit 10-domain-containing protein [Xylaria grammica]|nr:anaphase-promoting complex, subunit 10-domain-containing protein [Xylaria grammica]